MGDGVGPHPGAASTGREHSTPQATGSSLVAARLRPADRARLGVREEDWRQF